MSKNNHFTSVEQILSYTITTESGCMEWQRARSRFGYGMVWHRGKAISANRLALIFTIGEPETKSVAMHLCDNPPCINPDHLRWGTHSENSKDMVAKGRQVLNGKSGTEHHNAKLNLDAVAFIRKAYGADYSQKYLAKLFGVGETTIGNVLKNRIWK